MTEQLKQEDLRTRLKRQVDIVDWNSLIPSFTKGVVVLIDESVDLIEAGVMIVEDKVEEVKALMQENRVQNVTDDHHKQFLRQDDAKFYMVVVAPYVLVQPFRGHYDA